ncbi:MAG: carotenoid 1,2-hydratase, partial [Proteobacteria bacterium]|nr:carotenoid 1,2-hydratase [Pseudomonadota bacterium]
MPEGAGHFRRLGVAVAALWLAVTPAAAPAEGWSQAEIPRQWSFPRDHGAHPEYATEWWYFTGTLADASAGHYGYQLTIFRVGLRLEAGDSGNPWSVRDVYLAHFALTEVGASRFRYADRTSRAGPGLAGASSAGLDVWVLDWSARQEGRVLRLQADTPEMALDLALTPRKPVVLHGEGGLSRKGPNPGQASYYASITDLATGGRIRTEPGGATVPVTGTSWFDHEFGSNQLAEDQAGWDWFSLHLSDGQDLMLYLLRRKDGTVEPASSGTLVSPSGTARHLPREAFAVEPLSHWTSPRTGGRYPARWRLRVPAAEIDLTVASLVADQELVTAGSTGVVYWEGIVAGG